MLLAFGVEFKDHDYLKIRASPFGSRQNKIWAGLVAPDLRRSSYLTPLIKTLEMCLNIIDIILIFRHKYIPTVYRETRKCEITDVSKIFLVIFCHIFVCIIGKYEYMLRMWNVALKLKYPSNHMVLII